VKVVLLQRGWGCGSRLRVVVNEMGRRKGSAYVRRAGYGWRRLQDPGNGWRRSGPIDGRKRAGTVGGVEGKVFEGEADLSEEAKREK
jgi:hypothetical protein